MLHHFSRKPHNHSFLNPGISWRTLEMKSFSDLNGAEAKVTLLSKIRDGIQHYWHGSKLLAYETKISSRLLLKILNGKRLARREHRQLLRTTSDLLRLVPFLIIVLVPFLEFALPIILKLFPNMLPSTFEDKNSKVLISFSK